MNLPKGSGLEQLNRILSPGIKRLRSAVKDSGLLAAKPEKRYTYRIPEFRMPDFRMPDLTEGVNKLRKSMMGFNPVQELRKGITSMISQVTGKTEAEDYNTVIKGFIPADARILKPQYPAGTESWQLADLDGDSRNELVATYRHTAGLKTLILKKKDGSWHKAAEIAHPEHDGINYRSVSDIAGSGGMQLMLGLTAKGMPNTLHGYVLGENTAKKLFSRNYDWVEFTRLAKGINTRQKNHLAVWNKDPNGMYDIEVLGWNGLQLTPAVDATDYYYKRIAPYYYRKLRQQPASVHGLYKLAEALKRAGAYRDAYRMAAVGTRLIDEPEYKNRFSALKDEITELMQ